MSFLNSFYIYFLLKYIFFLLFFSITAILFYFILGCIYISTLYNQFFIIFIFYFFINIWFYFYNIYSFSKYTSSIQSFWNSTFMLFWVIEFFLFSIFLYLLFISPSEPYYMYSSANLNCVQLDCILSNDILFLCTVMLSSISSVSIFFIKYNNTQATTVLLLTLFFIFTFLFINELFSFLDCFYFMSKLSLVSYVSFINYSYLSISVDSTYINSSVLDTSASILDAPFVHNTNFYYMFVLCFLNFWHIVFIYIIFVISLVAYIANSTISFDSMSSLCQNFIYAVLFSSLPYIIYFVFLFSVIFSNPYFYIDNSCFSNYTHLLNEISLTF